jgi:uncharacterized membrane protein YeaQ/YmgE (transglycosylase-associated protein family)
MRDILIWFVAGWGLSSAFWIHIWMPDPPPDAFTRFIGTSVAGILGGLVGGAIVGAVSSDPMPAHSIAGALAGSAILTGALLASTFKGRKASG